MAPASAINIATLGIHKLVFRDIRFHKLHEICRYTVSVNKGNIIHVLLVAILCYGQLVANIHAIGHLDTPVAHESGELAHHDDAKTAHHNHSSSASLADGPHRHASATSEHDAEIECAIYHTYLSQGSAFCDPGDHALLILTYASKSGDTFEHPFSLAVQSQSIRAPPITS